MSINQIRGSVMVGPTNLMALNHPFITPIYNKVPGMPIGIDTRSREVVCVDPWYLKNAGIINSAFGMILALKGEGKSSILKILTTRLMSLAAGYQFMRVSINDYKPEGRASEYGLLTEQFRSKQFYINQMSVNPLEARLFMSSDEEVYELGMLNIVEMICEFVHGDRLLGHYATALRVAMSVVLREYAQPMWSLHLLEKVCRSLSEEQIQVYFSSLDGILRQQMSDRLVRISDAHIKQSQYERINQIASQKTNANAVDIQQGGMYVSSLLSRVLHGKYGHMFGTKHSLYEMLTQRVVTQDWRGIDPEAEMLMRTLLTQIKMSAIENNRLDLLPHIELDDEKHKSMDNIVYARGHSFFSEIARGTHTCNLSATHRLNSIRKGGVGSELYNLGETIINNLGFVLIGRQNNHPEVLRELQERYSLSRSDTELLPRLPKYTFGYKAGEEEKIRFMRVFATPAELPLLGTDSSTDRMVNRPGIISQERIEQFAKTNGIKMIGTAA